MDYRQLGRSGLRVSTLTLGTMTFGGGGKFANVGATDVDEAAVRMLRRSAKPVILVANHFNGLVDAVLLAIIVRGFPRFIAKATLWHSLLLRPLLALAGLVPVSRPEDRDPAADQRPQANVASFERACELLRRRGTLAIFPEGTTHDRLELARVRTGAARIALSARASGIHGVTIVPVGLTFDDKLALRSRVLARIGDPIDLDAWVTHGHSGGADGDGDAGTSDGIFVFMGAFTSLIGGYTPTVGDEVVLRVHKLAEAFGRQGALVPARLTEWRIGTGGPQLTFAETQIADRVMDLPAHDRRHSGRPTRHGWFATTVPPDSEYGFELAGLCHVDLETGEFQPAQQLLERRRAGATGERGVRERHPGADREGDHTEEEGRTGVAHPDEPAEAPRPARGRAPGTTASGSHSDSARSTPRAAPKVGRSS